MARAAPLNMKRRLRGGGGALEKRKRGEKEREGEKRGGSEKGEIMENVAGFEKEKKRGVER